MKKPELSDFALLAHPKVDNNISYQTLPATSGVDLAAVQSRLTKTTVIPVKTAEPDTFDDIPSTRDFKVMGLQSRIASLIADKKNLNDKLSRCLYQLTEELRVLKLRHFEDEEESYSERRARMLRVEAMIELINDPLMGAATQQEELIKIYNKEKKS